MASHFQQAFIIYLFLFCCTERWPGVGFGSYRISNMKTVDPECVLRMKGVDL